MLTISYGKIESTNNPYKLLTEQHLFFSCRHKLQVFLRLEFADKIGVDDEEDFADEVS